LKELAWTAGSFVFRDNDAGVIGVEMDDKIVVNEVINIGIES
jgi:hypothetical protein